MTKDELLIVREALNSPVVLTPALKTTPMITTKAIALIDKALEETQSVSPEPDHVWGVDWGKAGDSPCVSIIKRLPGGGIEVVAVEYGPKREWRVLTDEELKPICDEYRILFGYWVNDFARAIEAKLKEKNNE